jgi:hypothetical protein
LSVLETSFEGLSEQLSAKALSVIESPLLFYSVRLDLRLVPSSVIAARAAVLDRRSQHAPATPCGQATVSRCQGPNKN